MKFERGSGSQNEKPTGFTCGKRHYGKCLAVTSGCFGFGKDDHKVTYCPTIAARGRESKKVAPNAPKDDVPRTKAHFYALWARGSKPDVDDDDDGKSLYIFSGISYF